MRRGGRVLKIVGAALIALVGLVLLSGAVVVTANWAAFGKRADGERLARMKRSPQWDEDGFENPQPLFDDFSIEGLPVRSLMGATTQRPSIQSRTSRRFAEMVRRSTRHRQLGCG